MSVAGDVRARPGDVRLPAAARSAAVVVVGAALAGIATWLADAPLTGILTFVLLLALGGVAVAGAHVMVARRARAGMLARQFWLVAAVALGQVLVVVAVAVASMFVSGHDAALVAAIVVFAGLVALRIGQLYGAGVLRDVFAIRDGLERVGRGERDPRIATEGHDELAQLAAAANEMTARLAREEQARDAADGARRRLVAAISHDLRTPLTSLMLLAEAVEDEIVDEQTRRRYLRAMRTHIDALDGLVDDLFELSRLEAGEIRWSMEQVRVDELVAETVEAMRPAAEAKCVAVAAELSGDLAPARANPEKLQRVLFNLIQNAIRHTPSDGSVTVRAEGSGEAVEIEVADSGPGIAPVDRPRVFEAFFRGGTDAARPPGGAGLGLAISRAIVEAHGGRIWLADGDGPGTRVRLRLPAAGSGS